jgi:hypothetical protein
MVLRVLGRRQAIKKSKKNSIIRMLKRRNGVAVENMIKRYQYLAKIYNFKTSNLLEVISKKWICFKSL